MKLITLDLETWGIEKHFLLQPWRMQEKSAGIVSLIATSGVGNVAKWADNEPAFNFYSLIKKLADGDSDVIICGWNLLFDLSWLLAFGGQEMYRFLNGFKFLDGMLLYRRLAGIYKTTDRMTKYSLLAKSSKTSSLKAILAQFAQNIDFKDVSGILYKQSYNDVEFKAGLPDYKDKQMIRYNIRDTLYTHALIDFLIKHSSKHNLLQAIRESSISLLFAKAWENGIHIDKQAVENVGNGIQESLQKIMLELEVIGITSNVLMSPKQLGELLTDRGVKLCVTGKGNISVNDASLKTAILTAEGDITKVNLINKILTAKSYETELSKFINPAKILPSIIHPQPFLQSTVTGRLTYSVSQSTKVIKKYKNGKEVEVTKSIKTGLPLHQIKRGPLRKLFCAPEGYNLVEMDFAAQEMRIIAWLANETTMLEFFNGGKDLHALMGSKLAGMGYDAFLELKQSDSETYKAWRTVGKVTNLALQYRLSANGLYGHWCKVGINKSRDEAIHARSAYLNLFPSIQQYWTKNTNFAKNNGYITNKAGRKLQITEWGYDASWNSEQTAINFPVQSLGAEMKVVALYKLMPFLKKNDIQFMWDLHDGMYFYVPKCLAQYELLCEMKDIVENINYKKTWDSAPTVKFPVEIKLGANWADLEEIKF